MHLLSPVLQTPRIPLKVCSRVSAKYKKRIPKFQLRGFVGEGGNLASQYHSQDFDWNELYATEGHKLENFNKRELAVRVGSEEEPWDRFFRLHGAPRFFKERRYLLKAFPSLMQTDPPVRLVDLGAGYGSSILPIMKSNNTCTVVAVDISPTALNTLNSLTQDYGILKDRLSTVRADLGTYPFRGLDTMNPRTIHGNYALMVFVLSALDPASMRNALQNAFDLLEPGGRLLFRDYGFCDMSQLRFPQTQRLGRQSYMRQDETLAYYFDVEEIKELTSAVGFLVEECKFVCLLTRNRRTGQEMKRVFVHGVFWKNSAPQIIFH